MANNHQTVSQVNWPHTCSSQLFPQSLSVSHVHVLGIHWRVGDEIWHLTCP